MSTPFDAAKLGKRCGRYRFNTDPDAIADSLREMADEIEAGNIHVLKLHSAQSIADCDFSARSVVIRYISKEEES